MNTFGLKEVGEKNTIPNFERQKELKGRPDVWDNVKFAKSNDEVKQIRHITTINERYEGQVHPEANVPYRKHVFTLNGEKVEGVFPVFESKFNVLLPKNLRMDSDLKQFDFCVKCLARRIENDPEFAKQFTARQIEQIKNGEPNISGLTWHHNEVPGRMQLVNTREHAICRHTGGRSIWGGGSDCR